MEIRIEKLPQTGRILFALGLLGIAIENFIYQDFMIGRAPKWPETMPGGLVWAYLTGIIFIVISLLILAGIKARIAAIVAAALIFLWAFLRHIPVVAADTFLSGAWTAAGKALVFIGGALAIAATFPTVHFKNQSRVAEFLNLGKEFIVAGRICLGAFLVLAGVQHFMFAEFVASLMPSWFPGDAAFWTYFAGVVLILGGVGLFIPKTASLSALLSGIMVFSWVWIIHVPRIMVSVSDNIAVFEALAFSGIAFAITRSPEVKR